MRGYPTAEVQDSRDRIDRLQLAGPDLDWAAYEAERRELERLYADALQRQWRAMGRH